MAWCKVSSLTAAVSLTLRGVEYPASKARLLLATKGKTVEGWELDFFLEKALRNRTYTSLREVMTDLEDWLERQG